MSGHSHYATIKRQKETRDQAKGKIFSKLARAIQIAVKTGGSSDPDANSRLRMVIETARSEDMPKENIDRAISKGMGSGEVLEEVTYEGFGPGGVAVIVEAATDNRNRTGQEIKNLFERSGGNLAGPGAVSFNFEPKGLIVVEKAQNVEEQILSIIDTGVDDVEEKNDAIEVYVAPNSLSVIKNGLSEKGYSIRSAHLIKRPLNFQTIDNQNTAQKVLGFLDDLEDQDDVQKVYANLDIPDQILQNFKN